MNPRSLKRLHWHWEQQRSRSAHFQPRYSRQQVLASWLGALVGIGLLGWLTQASGYPLVAAPMGATSVLLFGVPNSPLAQPRNVILGNSLGAVIAVLCVLLLGGSPWSMGFAVGITIALTQLLRCVHPPAGAVALLGVIVKAKWAYILLPVLSGSVLLCVITALYSRWAPDRQHRRYPLHWL